MKPVESVKAARPSSLQAKPIRPPVMKTPAPPAPTPSTLIGELDRIWAKSHLESVRRLRALQPETRGLIDLQVTFNQLGLGTQLLAQAAEAVNSTLRKAQQLGAG